MTELRWTTETRRLRDLKPWPRNPRQIRKDEADRLNQSLDQFGQVDTIAIGPDGEVYNGHQRINVWGAEHGDDYEVEVRVASRALLEKEREKLTVFLHRGAAGEWDFDTLANEFDLDDLLEWGFEERDLELDLWHEEPPEDPGPQVDRAEELQEKWGVNRGDIWQIGRHRLMCGDSTSAEDVGRLMGGEKAGAIITDPPYGMDVDTSYAKMHHGEGVYTVNRFQRVRGDDKPFEPAPLLSMFDCCREIVLFGGDYYVHQLPKGGSWFCWDKRWNDSGIDLDKVHGSAFELIWSKKPHKREIARITWSGHHGMATDDLKSRMHPTQKPVALFDWLLQRINGNPVVDIYCGVGGCLVACEQTNRIGYGMEIEPKYCAVTLERLAGMGLEPQLVNTTSEHGT